MIGIRVYKQLQETQQCFFQSCWVSTTYVLVDLECQPHWWFSFPGLFVESDHSDIVKDETKFHVATDNVVVQGQLYNLMQRLETTEPHFIRCIKPNTKQLPNVYEQELVLQQLRCCGVLEVVRISRSGYPTRHSHHEFAKRLEVLESITYHTGSNLGALQMRTDCFDMPGNVWQTQLQAEWVDLFAVYIYMCVLDNLTYFIEHLIEISLICFESSENLLACRYGFLLPKSQISQEDPLSICVAILHQFGIPSEMYQVGITKLFFRAGQVISLHLLFLFWLWTVYPRQKLVLVMLSASVLGMWLIYQLFLVYILSIVLFDFLLLPGALFCCSMLFVLCVCPIYFLKFLHVGVHLHELLEASDAFAL